MSIAKRMTSLGALISSSSSESTIPIPSELQVLPVLQITEDEHGCCPYALMKYFQSVSFDEDINACLSAINVFRRFFPLGDVYLVIKQLPGETTRLFALTSRD